MISSLSLATGGAGLGVDPRDILGSAAWLLGIFNGTEHSKALPLTPMARYKKHEYDGCVL